MSGQKIIDGLKDALAGNFARVTIEGQTWVRIEHWQDTVKALSAARGYLLNAKIDLESGARKATAIRTIDGGLTVVGEALAAIGENSAIPPNDGEQP